MNIGIIGLGKLGLPVAVTMATRGVRVVGWDIDHTKMLPRKYEHLEAGPDGTGDFQSYFDQALATSNLTFASSIQDLCRQCNLIFLAVQTPHQPQLDGGRRLAEDSQDFDYRYLKAACQQLVPFLTRWHTVVVISTVLPGTTYREVAPILRTSDCRLVYNPFFIAMGTVMRDFLKPEFVLLGRRRVGDADMLSNFYRDLYSPGPLPGRPPLVGRPPFVEMSWESAELTKVAYNLFISTKICYANTLMEIAHKTPGCHVDDVTSALKLATDRLISPKYLSAGGEDGGGCHPRDLIAMSYLGDRLSLSQNLFHEMRRGREWRAEWLCELFLEHAGSLPKVLLGKAFKPETNITTGSYGLLCADILRNWHGIDLEHYDPVVTDMQEPEQPAGDIVNAGPAAYLICTKHECFRHLYFSKGSVVVDPFRYIPEQDGVKIILVGVGQ